MAGMSLVSFLFEIYLEEVLKDGMIADDRVLPSKIVTNLTTATCSTTLADISLGFFKINVKHETYLILMNFTIKHHHSFKNRYWPTYVAPLAQTNNQLE